MARGRRKAVSNLTLEEQVASIQAEIDNLAEKMKDAKARKKNFRIRFPRGKKKMCTVYLYNLEKHWKI